jgi:hypothetical protein
MTSNILTGLGFVIGLSQFLSQYHIAPDVMNPISAVGTIAFGILAKGVGTK